MNPSFESESESQFEVRLRRQPIRSVPAGWRDAILQEASAAAPSEGETAWEGGTPLSLRGGTAVAPVAAVSANHAPARTRPEAGQGAGPGLDLRRWFSLPRLGWLGLAGAWVLIFALHVAGKPEPWRGQAGEPPAISEAWAVWAQNQRELARLLDTQPAFSSPPANRPPRQQSRLPIFPPLA